MPYCYKLLYGELQEFSYFTYNLLTTGKTENKG
jgi:hypothetical protein